METKSQTCTKKSTSTTMATKSKRVKVDSSKVSEQAGDDLRAVVTRLESELDVERKSNKQLRREKAVEVQQVREAEQSRCSASQKELAAKLHQEKQKEVEALKESLKCRHEAEIVKAIKQKDTEIKKLQKDLQKCQDELKEEIAKRGLSTSARSAFELERAKLLQEIKELTSAKKQLEDALRAATEAEKQKNLEIRQLQENCKLEVARVEKEAGIEVRKLLEELKTKDNLLAQMDRSQYPDRVNALRQHLASQPVDSLLSLSKELETKSNQQKQEPPSSTPVTVTGLQNIAWQKKIYELEKQIRVASGLNHAFVEKNKEIATINQNLEGKIKNLAEENKELNTELTSAKAEMKKMNDRFCGSSLESLTTQLEKLRKQIKDQEKVIGQLRFDCQEKDRQLKLKLNKPKKAVRFLLPGETVPRAPGFDIDDVIENGHQCEDNADSMSVDSSLSDITCPSSQPSSETNLTDEDRELIETGILLENVENDYEQLMKEHLALEQSYALLLHSYSIRSDGDQPPEDWKIERESLNLAIYALEQKVHKCEENEQLLRTRLEVVTEEKEELEFKVLEHEECAGNGEDAEMMEKNQQLESELNLLRKKLDRYENSAEKSERDVGLQCDPCEMEDTEKVKVIVTQASALLEENLTKCDSLDDIATDSGSEMLQSFSTTASSGFDETCSEAEESVNSVSSMLPVRPEVEGQSAPVEDKDKQTTITEECLREKMLNQRVEVKTSDEVNSTMKEGEGKAEDSVLEMETTIKNFQTMEETWKSTVTKLERQLQQGYLRERIIRDQMVLVEEEKNRRIGALQGQIDILEDNETRLSDTIKALEKLALGVKALDGQIGATEADAVDRTEAEGLDASHKQLSEEVEELTEAGKILGQVKICISGKSTPGELVEISESLGGGNGAAKMPAVGSEVITLVDAVEAALQNSIIRLENVNVQLVKEVKKEKEINEHIQKLERVTRQKDVKDDDSAEGNKDTECSIQKKKSDVEHGQVASALAMEELQSGLRDLRGLLIRLKAVIDVEEADCRGKSEGEKSEISTSGEAGNKEARDRLRLDMMLEIPRPVEDWLVLTPPGIKSFSDFSERDDATEFQLRQKVEELEKDCERLQNLVHEEEQVIRHLHFQNLELQDSEKNLQQMVERLETTEEQMHEKMDEMAEEMEKLQLQLKQAATRDRQAKAQVTKLQESEAELEEKLELTMEEMQNYKRKMEKKLMELENEKKNLIKKTEEQADRIGDLEGLSGSLKMRIRNLESSESSLRSEVRKLEGELSTAGGHLSELEQQKEALVQHLQDLEKEKSKLLFEIADLTMDSNKQGHKISLLNQEITKLRGSLVNKDEVIACLQSKLEEATGMLDGLRVKLAAYENREDGLLEEANGLTSHAAEQEQRIRELEQELRQKQRREVVICDQSTQTCSTPIKAKVIIEKATSVFQESFEYLGEHHPEILREFLSASLLPLLASYDDTSDATGISTETMKRFIASLQIDFPRESKIIPQKNVHFSSTQNGHAKEEEKQWNKVEDPHVIYDVRAAEDSTYWKDIENHMGLNTEDLALTIEFKDSVDSSNCEQSVHKDKNNIEHDANLIPPPLPTSSPPPLSPEPRPDEEIEDESADEASEINEEDDGAVPVSEPIHSNWTVRYQQTSPRQQWITPTASQPIPVLPSESQLVRARSVDRDCIPTSQKTFHGTLLHGMAAGSVESITDSGMDSMKQIITSIPEHDVKQGTTRKSLHYKSQIRDQAIQTSEETKPPESVIILRTQLEQRERELAAKSNEMDRVSQEMRRWQQEAVSLGEERARLSALLGCALKDLKVMQGNSSGMDVKSPTGITKVLKSPLGLATWGTSAGTDKTRATSHIPVSIRHSSLTEKDFSQSTQRPTSLYSDPSHSSSSSTDGALNSESSSSYTSPIQDRKSVSYIPRPIKDIGPTYISPTATSSRKEADRLFRQSLELSQNPNKQSASTPSPSGSESIADLLSPLQAVEPATSGTTGASGF